MSKRMVGLSFKVPEELRDALNEAARSDLRSASALGELVLGEWLRQRGFMGEPPKGGPTHRRNRARPKRGTRAAEAAPAPAPREEPAEPVPAAVARERPQRRRDMRPRRERPAGGT